MPTHPVKHGADEEEHEVPGPTGNGAVRYLYLLAGTVSISGVAILVVTSAFGQFFNPNYRSDPAVLSVTIGAMLVLVGVRGINKLAESAAQRLRDMDKPK